jgi:hypothetical protein
MLDIKLERGQEQRICDALKEALLKLERRVAELEGVPPREVEDRAGELAAEVYAEELGRSPRPASRRARR